MEIVNLLVKTYTMHTLLDIRSASPHFPGIGRYVRSLTSHLPESLAPEDAITLLSVTDSTLDWLHADVGFQTIESTASPFSLDQQWRIPGLLNTSGAQLYHSPYYLMPYRPGLPTALTVYDLIPIHYPQTARTRTRLLFRLTTILALRAATKVIAISQATRQDFITTLKVPPQKIVAIPLAAGSHFKPASPETIQQIRQKYNLIDNFVLYVGINKPHKNLINLIKAWKMLSTDRRLVIGGAWDENYPEARQVADNNSSIRFLGPLPDADLPPLYSAADLFVFPSLYEGFGLPVLEAMSCGTAVACSHASSLPEVAGETAFYFNPLQVESIAAVLRSVLKDENGRNAKALAGRERAQVFTWRETTRQTVSAWREVISTGG